MSRRKSSINNTIIALFAEGLVAIVGFFFPRALIVNYGSATNGLISSLQQLIQYFSLVEAGLSGAAIFALYKPLATNNTEQINRILYSSKRLFFKLGIVFILLVIVSSIIYPTVVAEVDYSDWMVSLLFCLIGLNGASQLLFVGKYKILLIATQNNRYPVFINSICTCLFSAIIIICSYCKIHILLAVSLATITYLFRSLAYYFVVRKKFPHFQYTKKYDDYKFQNQREVFIQQILSMIIMNSSVFILTISRTDMSEISVFTVYNLVLTAVIMISNTVSNGVSASFGDLIARQDEQHLRRVYCEFEYLFQIFWSIIFSCMSVLYKPFIAIYSSTFTDAIYVRTTLCLLFSILAATWSIRIQQSIIIVAAGKFKEIQKASVIEAVLAVVLSAIGMYHWGMEGLIIGRIIASVYRMIDFILFNHHNILHSSSWITYKGIIGSSFVVIGINLLFSFLLKNFLLDTYFKWAMFAFFVALASGICGTCINSLFYRNEAKRLLVKIKCFVIKP